MRDTTNQYEIRVLVKDRSVQEYPHTDGYTYVEGRAGSEYVLELVNLSYERVLMVPSVDGLSVLNGKQDWEDGYVVNPHATMRVPGWRRDNTKVAAFEFADPRDSYTNRVGNGATNVGVIGLMVYREKQQWPTYSLNSLAIGGGLNSRGMFDAGMLGSNSIAAAAGAEATAKGLRSSELGTGWGEDTTFHTTEVKFEKRDSSYPDAIVALYYDSSKGLERRGIVVRNNYVNSSNPNPFPGYTRGPSVPPPPPALPRKWR